MREKKKSKDAYISHENIATRRTWISPNVIDGVASGAALQAAAATSGNYGCGCAEARILCLSQHATHRMEYLLY